MNNKTKNFGSLIFLMSVFILLSCKKGAPKSYLKSSEVTNLKGQVIFKNSSSSLEYSPKDFYINLKFPSTGLWQNAIITSSNKTIDSKIFFANNEDERTFLYDQLSLSDYQLKLISSLNDTITELVSLKSNLELSLSEEVNSFYNQTSLDELINQIIPEKDTLQLFFQEYGCFGDNETLIEFFFKENAMCERIRLKKPMNDKSINENWVYYENKNIEVLLDDFFDKANKLKHSNLDACTADLIYIFRIKNSKNLAFIEDKSCELKDDIEKLLYPKEEL